VGYNNANEFSRWVARYREPGIGADGGTLFVRRSEIIGTVAELPTRRDAELILSNKLHHLDSANYHPRSCCSLRDFVEEWKAQALPALKYASQQHYEYVVETHLLPVFGNVQLRLISRESIQSLLASKLKQGLSWRSARCNPCSGTPRRRSLEESTCIHCQQGRGKPFRRWKNY
jgi:Phage integrase, N-terminal SAM-like domain